MPTVEKTTGGRVYLRSIGEQFTIGDRATVTEEKAEYLCEERGDFERVHEDATDVEFFEVETDEPDPEDEWAVDADDGDADATDAEDDNAVAEGPYRDPEAVEAGHCGYTDPETDGDPCGRDAGWGRDEDDGPCKDHVDKLE